MIHINGIKLYCVVICYVMLCSIIRKECNKIEQFVFCVN